MNLPKTKQRSIGTIHARLTNGMTRLLSWQNAKVWELEVPNGEYKIRIVAGDAQDFSSTYRINADDILVVNGRPDSHRGWPWVEGTEVVTVRDGRLTISGAHGAPHNKLCFVEIEARSAGPAE